MNCKNNQQHQQRQRYFLTVSMLFVLLISACAAPMVPAAAPTDDGNASAATSGESYIERAETEHRASREERAPQSTYSADASAADGPRSHVDGRPSACATMDTHDGRTGQYEPVTAGVVDDNEQWPEYLEYRDNHRHVRARDRDISERHRILVTDATGMPVHDASVEVFVEDRLLFTGRTDTAGQLFFHPLAVGNLGVGQRWINEFRVVAGKQWIARSQTFDRYAAGDWIVELESPVRAAAVNLDLLFLIDATGSMDDEIAKLKASMADVADQIARLPEQPDVRYALVAYRDHGDAFVVREYDFTYDLGAFQQTLNSLRANGGGDEPEALDEALHTTINEMSWRNEDAVRLVLLVADAPPHLDNRQQPFHYDDEMVEAVARGIKLFPIGASGLNQEGEYVFRQLAQFTGGKFVFLTYEDGSDPSSGPGTETEHDVDNYSVNTLDRLVVRLVRDELSMLNRMTARSQPMALNQPQSPLNLPAQPIVCTFELDAATSTCGALPGIEILEGTADSVLVMLTLDPASTGFASVRLDLEPDGRARDWVVHVGDSRTNVSGGGDLGTQSNDAQLLVTQGSLLVYGNDRVPRQETVDGQRLVYADRVAQDQPFSLELANNRLIFSGQEQRHEVSSPYLFALAAQADSEGAVNHDLYVAVNRNIDGSVQGHGLQRMQITLIPG